MRVPTERSGPICDFDRTVTPMVDVVFQLLIFFVLASGGRIAEQAMSTTLAAGTVSSQGVESSGQTAGQPAEAVSKIWIHLKRDAKQQTIAVLAGHRYTDLAALESPLRKLGDESPSRPVIIDAAGDVPVGDVIRLYDVCRAARLNSINFAAAPDELQPRGSG